MWPDHANTCRPIIRACTGFSDEWEASVNVRVGHSRLDQTFAFSKPDEPPLFIEVGVFFTIFGGF